MSNKTEPWGRINPEWTAPIVSVLKELDARDSKPKAAKYDGTYMGHDLSDIVSLYKKKYSSHEPGIQRIFEATLALDGYIAGKKSKAASDWGTIVIDAMFEGVCALLESRTPDYDENVEGFGSKFIEEEFDFLFTKEIAKGNALKNGGSWTAMWSHLLDGCHTDFFLNGNDCPF